MANYGIGLRTKELRTRKPTKRDAVANDAQGLKH